MKPKQISGWDRGAFVRSLLLPTWPTAPLFSSPHPSLSQGSAEQSLVELPFLIFFITEFVLKQFTLSHLKQALAGVSLCLLTDLFSLPLTTLVSRCLEPWQPAHAYREGREPNTLFWNNELPYLRNFISKFLKDNRKPNQGRMGSALYSIAFSFLNEWVWLLKVGHLLCCFASNKPHVNRSLLHDVNIALFGLYFGDLFLGLPVWHSNWGEGWGQI